MSYTTSLKVRFGDIDHAGVAYYPNLFHYFHIAFEEFFEEFVGQPYPRVLGEERLGFPTVKVDTEFSRPVRYGDTLRIAISIPRVGGSSIDIVYTATRAGDSAPAIVSRQTIVAVDMDTFRPTRLPDKYRQIFSRCATTA